MAWTTPRTWVSGETVTAALMNAHVRDNLAAALPGGAAGTAVTFAAGNFTANGSMTWTVASGDQTTFRYVEVGKVMHMWVYLVTTTVGGTPNTQLRVAIPNSRTSAATVRGVFAGTDNGTDVTGGVWEATSGTAYVTLYKSPSAGNWTASTDNTAIFGYFVFEVA